MILRATPIRDSLFGVYDVSPDGRFLMPVPIEQTGSLSLTVVLNWAAALKK
jgi:hypothetical protein